MLECALWCGFHSPNYKVSCIFKSDPAFPGQARPWHILTLNTKNLSAWAGRQHQNVHSSSLRLFKSEDRDEFQFVKCLLYAWHCFNLSYIIYPYIYISIYICMISLLQHKSSISFTPKFLRKHREVCLLASKFPHLLRAELRNKPRQCGCIYAHTYKYATWENIIRK